MNVYVVHRAVDGYAHEDAKESDVVGVYTNVHKASIIATATHGRVCEIKLDEVKNGIAEHCKQIGFRL